MDLESGPQLPGTIHRLHSLALESVGPHAVGAWMLYDDEAGRRRVVCVPLAFNDATVRAGELCQLEAPALLAAMRLSRVCCCARCQALLAGDAPV